MIKTHMKLLQLMVISFISIVNCFVLLVFLVFQLPNKYKSYYY